MSNNAGDGGRGSRPCKTRFSNNAHEGHFCRCEMGEGVGSRLSKTIFLNNSRGWGLRHSQISFLMTSNALGMFVCKREVGF